jgi:hypothetical protein
MVKKEVFEWVVPLHAKKGEFAGDISRNGINHNFGDS